MGDALDRQVGGDHYSKLKIQPIEFIHGLGLPFIEASVVKYIIRWRDKGGIQDLEKIKHYIDLLIELENKSDSIRRDKNKPAVGGTTLRGLRPSEVGYAGVRTQLEADTP